jgi:hypothetical protein
VLGLTFPLAVEAQGRVEGGASYQKNGVANGVLIGASMSLVDRQAGSCRYDFQNRASSQVLATEAPTVAGSAPLLTSRATLIRIKGADSTFTPTGGAGIALDGLAGLSWQARGQVVTGASPGLAYIDMVDIIGWEISGQATIVDTTLSGAMSKAETLASAIRGSLAVRCALSGQAEAASAPTDQILTFIELRFKNCREGIRTKQAASATVDFNQLLRTTTTVHAIGDMLTAAAAGA